MSTANYNPSLHQTQKSIFDFDFLHCTDLNRCVSRFLNAAAFLFLVVKVHGQSNLVQNGSFETYIAIPYSVSPWTPAPSLNLKWSNAPNGQNYANILTLSQDVHTVAGLSYSLSFNAAADL